MSHDPRDLTPRRRVLRLVPFGVSSALAVVGWWLAPGFGAAEFTLYALVLFVLGVRTAPQVLLEPDALVVRHRKTERRFIWATILEGSWGSGGLGRTGPMLRTVGSSFATPGPVMPTVVASWLLPGRHAQLAFAAACEERGIPYTPQLRRLIAQGQRRPRLPGDHDREALLAGTLSRTPSADARE